MSQNQEEVPTDSQKHSEPTDASIKENSDDVVTVTESIANMKTEDTKSDITSEAPSQNEPEQSQSIEVKNSNPSVASSIQAASDTNDTAEKGILI